MNLLFLCVAKSARSQMAEGLGRALSPEGTTVYSAGSEPTQVRPQAIAALREIGLNIESHTSKGIDDVPLEEMDLVITLCADEVCPVLPVTVRYLHWPLPDPAGAGETPEQELDAFRQVRDQLKERLEALFRDSN